MNYCIQKSYRLQNMVFWCYTMPNGPCMLYEMPLASEEMTASDGSFYDTTGASPSPHSLYHTKKCSHHPSKIHLLYSTKKCHTGSKYSNRVNDEDHISSTHLGNRIDLYCSCCDKIIPWKTLKAISTNTDRIFSSATSSSGGDGNSQSPPANPPASAWTCSSLLLQRLETRVIEILMEIVCIRGRCRKKVGEVWEIWEPGLQH